MYQKWSYRILESLRFLWSIHLEFWNILLRFWVILSQIIAVGCQIAIMTDWPAAAAARWRAFSALASATRCFFCAFSSTLRCFFSAAALDMPHSGSSWPVEFGFPKFLPTCSFQNYKIGSEPQALPFQISPTITVCKYLHQEVTQGYGNSITHITNLSDGKPKRQYFQCLRLLRVLGMGFGVRPGGASVIVLWRRWGQWSFQFGVTKSPNKPDYNLIKIESWSEFLPFWNGCAGRLSKRNANLAPAKVVNGGDFQNASCKGML